MSIRTTVTLDDDVLDRARIISRRKGIAFRQGLNDLLRKGIEAEQRAWDEQPSPFQVKPFSLGHDANLSYDKIGDLLEQLEGPFYR